MSASGSEIDISICTSSYLKHRHCSYTVLSVNIVSYCSAVDCSIPRNDYSQFLHTTCADLTGLSHHERGGSPTRLKCCGCQQNHLLHLSEWPSVVTPTSSQSASHSTNALPITRKTCLATLNISHSVSRNLGLARLRESRNEVLSCFWGVALGFV